VKKKFRVIYLFELFYFLCVESLILHNKLMVIIEIKCNKMLMLYIYIYIYIYIYTTCTINIKFLINFQKNAQ